MANAQFKAEYYAGKDLAQAVYLVDSTGTLYVSSALSAALPAGSNLIGGVNVVDSGGSNKLAVDASGRLTLIPNSSVNVAQLNGVTPQLDGGSSNRLGVSLYGKNAAAGDTPFLLDSGGRLNVIQTIGGSAISATNAEPNISNIQQLILNAQGFTATTGKIAAAANMAAQFWVPNTSTKNVLIWSVRSGYSNANQSAQFTYLTAQDANITGAGSTNDSANFLNLKAGGAAAASGATLIHNGGIASTSGTPLDFVPTPLNAVTEYLSAGMFILIPAGTAAGLAIYQATTAAGSWSMTVRWVEF